MKRLRWFQYPLLGLCSMLSGFVFLPSMAMAGASLEQVSEGLAQHPDIENSNKNEAPPFPYTPNPGFIRDEFRGGGGNSGSSNSGASSATQETIRVGDFEQQVLVLVNEERANAGLQPLSFDPHLLEAAEVHSENMALQDFFNHIGADGSTPTQRMQAAGFSSQAPGAENIAAGYGTPEEVVEGWMNSPGHRANILTPEFTLSGVGYYFLENDTGNEDSNHYWTQVFSAPPPRRGGW